MLAKVYINKIEKFLPNNPVSNDEMANLEALEEQPVLAFKNYLV